MAVQNKQEFRYRFTILNFVYILFVSCILIGEFLKAITCRFSLFLRFFEIYFSFLCEKIAFIILLNISKKKNGFLLSKSQFFR